MLPHSLMSGARGALLFVVLLLLALPGGAAAQYVELQPKMGEPLNGLSTVQLQRFLIGKFEFDRVFTVQEGLGPIFNQNSCASCHSNPIGGSGSITVTRFGFLDAKAGTFDPLANLGGSLLQSQAISVACQETVPTQANITALRVTPSTLGFGLVEAIPDADIIAGANSPPAGINGVVHMVPELENPGGPLRAGRFGWKAQLATVLSFSGDATLNEMGITNRLVGQENAPNGNLALLAQCDQVPDPEDGPDPAGFDFIDRVTDFQRYLAPPPQTPRSGMSGEAIFIAVGCADCHTPTFTTSNDPALESALRNKVIKPYSDFLLHDMGQAADFIVQGNAGQRFLRTPPLWGLRVRDPLWHDGRVSGGTLASRITGTGGIIDQHNALLSEAAPSAQAFLALTQADKDKVVAFLDSLGRAEFDADGDNDRDYADLQAFLAAQTGPGAFYTPDSPEAVFDVDQDGDVDDNDFDHFIEAYEVDDNGNGINDLIDILVNGTSFDSNGNLIPDETEFCQVDLGYQGPGNMELLVCGDDLTQPGSMATVMVRNALPNTQLFFAVSTGIGLYPVPSGGTIVPALPFLLLDGSFYSDHQGRRGLPIAGGGPAVTLVMQVATLAAGTLELSNGVQVQIGL